MPAVNGALSADALARLYGALANGGGGAAAVAGRPSTTSAASSCAARTPCSASGCAGGSATTTPSAPAEAPKAFGHYGYGGSGGWADPDLGLSLGFVTNRIGSVTTPMADLTLYRLGRVVRECALSASSGSRTPGTA